MHNIIVFNSVTGEIEGDCPICGVLSGFSEDDMYWLPQGHSYKVLSEAESKVIHEVDEKGYVHKVEAEKLIKSI